MKTSAKAKTSVTAEILFIPIPEEIKKKHFAEKSDMTSLGEMPLNQRRKEAGKPIYLIRYE